ncbi:hypothetical protein MIR68_009993 [Amoeboaphelidium protococcarum]|nr:hypothetical protein MIR68_012544 [Amoeboaphelidium protococcarum]KAI3632146.1 hypothetical protein MIR68_009982 [Amoeboaphelidium protococcarum]KAI3632157.1 hypothetical protein MIR68_009993 [Amoeboaphelidium protococcarum]
MEQGKEGVVVLVWYGQQKKICPAKSWGQNYYAITVIGYSWYRLVRGSLRQLLAIYNNFLPTLPRQPLDSVFLSLFLDVHKQILFSLTGLSWNNKLNGSQQLVCLTRAPPWHWQENEKILIIVPVMPVPSNIILELVEADKTLQSVVLSHLIDHLDFNLGPRLKICTRLCLRFHSVSLPLWTIAIQGILCCGCPLSLSVLSTLCAHLGWPCLFLSLSLSLVRLASCVGQNRVISSCVLAAGVAVNILRLLWRLLVIVCKWRRSLSIKASFARVVLHPNAIGPQFIVIGSFGFTLSSSSSLSSSFADAPQLDHRRSLQEYILISMPLVPQSPFIGSFGSTSSSS